MKKNVFLLIVAICMMGSFSLMAQETEKKKEIKDWMHAVAYKKDGTTFEGYLKISLLPCMAHIIYRMRQTRR